MAADQTEDDRWSRRRYSDASSMASAASIWATAFRSASRASAMSARALARASSGSARSAPVAVVADTDGARTPATPASNAVRQMARHAMGAFELLGNIGLEEELASVVARSEQDVNGESALVYSGCIAKAGHGLFGFVDLLQHLRT